MAKSIDLGWAKRLKMSDIDQVPLWVEYRRTRSISLRNRLVEANVFQVAIFALKKFPWLDQEDLVQESFFWILRAAESYDPEHSHGAPFRLYARSFILNAGRDTDQIERAPLHLPRGEPFSGKQIGEEIGDDDGPVFEIPDGSPLPDDQATVGEAALEAVDRVEEISTKMPPRERALLRSCVLEKDPLDTVRAGKRAGIGAATARNVWRSVRDQLRSDFASFESEVGVSPTTALLVAIERDLLDFSAANEVGRAWRGRCCRSLAA